MYQDPLKIIVIDHERSFYTTYETYFDSFLEYALKGVYPTIKDALCAYDHIFPDVIFSEIGLPDQCGIDSMRLFREKDPEVKIIMLSNNNDFELIKKAFKQGANGYVTKPLNERSLFNALDAVQREGATLSSDIAKKLIAMFQRKSRQYFSERENQVIDYLSQGATYKTIAEKLFVTPSAVNFHIQNIYLKLDVNSKSEALSKLRELEYA
ncbi:response regulator transcription factor [Ulvibacterium sp.]|uniref:response regulator n=1 Tax=Ulvibacterium sp. TaxID=2665914 RepID=UPI00262E2236|nr:response regulator transcription factor [Ulvibacterium sp.]